MYTVFLHNVYIYNAYGPHLSIFSCGFWLPACFASKAIAAQLECTMTMVPIEVVIVVEGDTRHWEVCRSPARNQKLIVKSWPVVMRQHMFPWTCVCFPWTCVLVYRIQRQRQQSMRKQLACWVIWHGQSGFRSYVS